MSTNGKIHIHDEIGEELAFDQIELHTVVVLQNTHRLNVAMTARVVVKDAAFIHFETVFFTLILYVKDGRCFDNNNHHILVRRYKGD